MPKNSYYWLFVGCLLSCSAYAEKPAFFGELETGPPPTDVSYGSRSLDAGPEVQAFDAMPPAPAKAWPSRLLRHGDPDDPGRHVGLGEPLIGTSLA
jgi:hypothetical protein